MDKNSLAALRQFALIYGDVLDRSMNAAEVFDLLNALCNKGWKITPPRDEEIDLADQVSESTELKKDDITTTDYIQFWQDCKLYVTVKNDESWQRVVRGQMNKVSHWPNVYLINEQGVVHRLETREIMASSL